MEDLLKQRKCTQSESVSEILDRKKWDEKKDQEKYVHYVHVHLLIRPANGYKDCSQNWIIYNMNFVKSKICAADNVPLSEIVVLNRSILFTCHSDFDFWFLSCSWTQNSRSTLHNTYVHDKRILWKHSVTTMDWNLLAMLYSKRHVCSKFWYYHYRPTPTKSSLSEYLVYCAQETLMYVLLWCIDTKIKCKVHGY